MSSHHGNGEPPELPDKIHQPKMLKLGTLGEHHHGKIRDDDKGELVMAVGSDVEKGVVIMGFGTSITWMGMTPKQVDQLCTLLKLHKEKLQSGETPEA